MRVRHQSCHGDCDHGSGQVEPLCPMTSESLELGRLILGLDAFGRHPEAEGGGWATMAATSAVAPSLRRPKVEITKNQRRSLDRVPTGCGDELDDEEALRQARMRRLIHTSKSATLTLAR
jgi:hypothetical protein